MKILIAPDKFKGTLSASEVTDIIADQLASLNADIIKMPMADGGEGTAEVLSRLLDMSPRTLPASNSLMQPIPAGATYYVNPSTRSVAVDSSSVLGLSLIDKTKSSPLDRTSYPFGELLAEIIETENPLTIYIGIGGTSTVDGGEGFLQALGYDHTSHKAKVTLPRIIALSDVAVPLVAPGNNPSSLTFAPQKGATDEEIAIIRGRLEKFRYRFSDIDSKFAGAGGGMGFALAVIGAEISLGADFLIRLADIPSINPDLIITGEGSLDSQTSLGKAAGTLIKYGDENRIPVIAIGGRVTPDFNPSGTAAVFSTQHYPPEGCLNYHKAKARLIAASQDAARWIAERQ